MLSLLLYAGALLAALVLVNVLIVRTIRAERARDAEDRRHKSQR